jgi:hypothetical protein
LSVVDTATRPSSEVREPRARAKPAPRKSKSGGFTTALFSVLVVFSIYFGWTIAEEEYWTAENGLGYWLGIGGGGLMLLLVLYPIRKRWRRMQRLGRVASWFRWHMVLGVIGPVLILYHANFTLGSLNSNVALFATLTVAMSGVFGRYIYSRIHYGLYGRHIELDELREEAWKRREELNLDAEIAAIYERHLTDIEKKVATTPDGFFSSLRHLLSVRRMSRTVRHRARPDLRAVIRQVAEDNDWDRRTRRRQLKIELRHLREYLGCLRKIVAFVCFERMFALWHVLHLPLFILLVVAAVVHVLAVHMY